MKYKKNNSNVQTKLLENNKIILITFLFIIIDIFVFSWKIADLEKYIKIYINNKFYKNNNNYCHINFLFIINISKKCFIKIFYFWHNKYRYSFQISLFTTFYKYYFFKKNLIYFNYNLEISTKNI